MSWWPAMATISAAGQFRAASEHYARAQLVERQARWSCKSQRAADLDHSQHRRGLWVFTLPAAAPGSSSSRNTSGKLRTVGWPPRSSGARPDLFCVLRESGAASHAGAPRYHARCLFSNEPPAKLKPLSTPPKALLHWPGLPSFLPPMRRRWKAEQESGHCPAPAPSHEASLAAGSRQPVANTREFDYAGLGESTVKAEPDAGGLRHSLCQSQSRAQEEARQNLIAASAEGEDSASDSATDSTTGEMADEVQTFRAVAGNPVGRGRRRSQFEARSSLSVIARSAVSFASCSTS